MYSNQELYSKAAAICIMHLGDAIQKVGISVNMLDFDPHGKDTADRMSTMYAVNFEINGRMVSTGSFFHIEELLEELNSVCEQQLVLSTPKKVIPMVAGNEAFQKFSQTLNQAS